MSKKPPQLLRPNSYYNVLRPYFVDVELPESQSGGRNGNNNSCSATIQAPNVAKARNTKQANGALHPMRAFNFNVNPLRRHGSPHVHTHSHTSHAPHPQAQQQPAAQQRRWQRTVEQLARAVAEKQKRSKQKSAVVATQPAATASESMFVSVSPDKHQLQWEEKTKAAAPGNETIMYRSLPLFEVLPPLATNNTQSLVYQHSYLLDGVQYDYGGGRQLQLQLQRQRQQQQPQDNSSKLKSNYVRFLKSISTHSNPSDRDVVFGNAHVLLTRAHGWERSRIEWLVELERRHELRRQRRQRGGGALWGEDEPAFDICCFPCNNILFWRGDWLH